MMQWMSLEVPLVYSTLGRSIPSSLLHATTTNYTQPLTQSIHPFCYISRWSNLESFPVALLGMSLNNHCRRQPSSRHNLQSWSKKKSLSSSVCWLYYNEYASTIFKTQTAKIIDGERNGEPSQEHSTCKLSVVLLLLLLSSVNLASATNFLPRRLIILRLIIKIRSQPLRQTQLASEAREEKMTIQKYAMDIQSVLAIELRK